MATKQKSIEDYRNAVKLLKLKVIKLQKQNEELTEKLRESGNYHYFINISNTQIVLFYLFQGIPVIETLQQGTLTNQSVMQAFSKGCKRVGITPEMLFRAADTEGLCMVKVEDFRLFLGRVRLGLSQSQITMIVRILDEDCSGIVKKDEYYDTLSAYGINEEKQGSGSRTYGQEGLLKYAKLLYLAKLSPEDSWVKMDQEMKGIIAPMTFSAFSHAIDFDGKLTEKEIVGIFNHIDLDKQGVISKFFYEQEVRKALKAISSDPDYKTGSNFFQQSKAEFNTSKNGPQSLILPQEKQKENKVLEGSRILDEDKYGQDRRRRMFTGDLKQTIAVCSKMQTLGIDVIEFISTLVKRIQNPQAGIMLYDVYNAFEEMNKKIPKTEQLKLFQVLDVEGNGSIDYDELMLFFHEIKKPQDPYDGLYEILTRKLEALEIDIIQYLAIEQVHEEDILDQDQFYEIGQILFCVPDKEKSDLLFTAMDTDEDGQLSANEMIQQVRKIMDIYNPPIEKYQPPQTQETNLNVDEYFEILKNMKPILQEDDYFDKHELKGKKILKTKWRTIFNSDIACLRYCYEVIAELNKIPKKKWTDPEFGSTPTDEYGSKSMYFADNDIPEGCPDPKDVKWLRPEEIITELVHNGNEDLIGKIPDVFDQDGAVANDVVQSKFLGNCWFVSALSIIARYDKYLQGTFKITQEAVQDLNDEEIQGMQIGVYPPCFQFLKKYGIYVMRFFKEASWRYVMIDDRLCFKDGKFVYGHTQQPTELWVNLIEKAYAKLHNCYYALTSGDIAQGLSDMTGYIADKRKIDINYLNSPEDKDKLWNVLIQAKNQGSMMGCSAEGEIESNIKINGEDSGILSGHAYAIIDVFEIPDQECNNYHKSHRLLKIRNPWGYGEWKLKWSEEDIYKTKFDQFIDKIDEYYEIEIEKAKQAGVEPPEPYQRGVDDGTFLICYKDWRSTFSNLFLCLDFPNEWSGLRAVDRFGAQSAGVPKANEASKIAYAQKNPQYIVDINRKDGKPAECYLTMQQIDGRLFKKEKYPFTNIMKFILICIFKLDKIETQLQKYDDKKMIASSQKVQLRRECDTDDLELPNGKYSIIPSCLKPGDQCEYSISFYYNCQQDEIKITKVGDPKFKFSLIAEEEENVVQTSQELKKLLKKQALDVLNQN